MEILKSCHCGALCGFYDSTEPEACWGEVSMYDEVETGDEFGWEGLHGCENPEHRAT